MRAHLAVNQEDGVWPEHVAIVTAFLACATQWRVVTVGGGFAPSRLLWLGLDYAGARIGMEAAGMAITPSLWSGVRLMEAEARDALNGTR
jgi:hypothetical protein